MYQVHVTILHDSREHAKAMRISWCDGIERFHPGGFPSALSAVHIWNDMSQSILQNSGCCEDAALPGFRFFAKTNTYVYY